MPTLNDNTLLKLNVPRNNNNFFSAFLLSLLLPIVKDDDEFGDAVTCLFGLVKAKISLRLRREIAEYTASNFPDSLNNLINVYLRPIVSQYIQDHQTDFIPNFFATSEDLNQRVNAINDLTVDCGVAEIKALSCIANVCVRVYTTPTLYTDTVAESSNKIISVFDTYDEEQASTSRGYLRHPVLDHRDCGYMALGITRQDAHAAMISHLSETKLNNQLRATRRILLPAIREALLTGCDLIKTSKDPAIMTVKGLKELLNGRPTYALFGSTIYYINTKCKVEAYKIEPDKEIKTIFPANDDQVEEATNEKLTKITSYTGHTLTGHTLLTNDFFNYLKDNADSNDIIFDAFQSNIEHYAVNLKVIRHYINYDIRDMKIDNGWAHPAVLQAIGHVQGLNLRLWELSQNDQLVQHSITRYGSLDDGEWVDLLFVDGNHFERLDLFEYEDSEHAEPLYPLIIKKEASNTMRCCQSIIETEQLSEEFLKQLRVEDPWLTACQLMLTDVLMKVPEKLAALSIGVLKKPIFEDPYTAPTLLTNDKADQFLLRYNDVPAQILSIKRDMSRVQLIEKDSATGAKIPWESNIGTRIGMLPDAIRAVRGMVSLGYGKDYAKEYETALAAASQSLIQNNYTEAATILDAEFSRWLFPKAARALYLTNEHYAIAHFFRAVCAEDRDDKKRAYAEYDDALTFAKRAGKPLSSLLIQLHKIKLLKKMSQNELPHPINREVELNRTLEDMTAEHEASFSEFYWKIHEKIVNMSNRFLTNKTLSKAEIQSANFFLSEDSLFMLSFFSNDRGKFMEIFNVFFQGVILVFFECNIEKNYLQAEQKETLTNQLPYRVEPNENVLLLLAVEKFKHCVNLLKNFRPAVQTDPAIYSSMMLIENFIVDFNFHNQGQPRCQNRVFFEEYRDVVQSLSTKVKQKETNTKTTSSSHINHSMFSRGTSSDPSKNSSNFSYEI